MIVALINNIVAPYVHRVLTDYAAGGEDQLHVVSCADTEPGRHWHRSGDPPYRQHLLNTRRFHLGGNRNVYFGGDLDAVLDTIAPDVVLIGGFTPTMLRAAASARRRGLAVGISMDGWHGQDPGTRFGPHRWIRRRECGRADFAVAASEKASRLLQDYGVPSHRCFVVPLVPAWDPPMVLPDFYDREYDLLWCGTINESHKGVRLFAATVAWLVAHGRRPQIRIVGEGPHRGWLQQRLRNLGVQTRFDGYLQPPDLAGAFASARLLLLPSRREAWGLVTNEAMQCGTPVLTSRRVGAADELVIDGLTGCLEDRVPAGWGERVERLLRQPDQWSALSLAARRAAAERTPADSARRLRAALHDIR